MLQLQSRQEPISRRLFLIDFSPPDDENKSNWITRTNDTTQNASELLPV